MLGGGEGQESRSRAPKFKSLDAAKTAQIIQVSDTVSWGAPHP